MKTAHLTNFLIRDKNKEVIKTCKSESLKTFQEKFEDMLSNMWSALSAIGGFMSMGVLFHSSSPKKEEDSDCTELPDAGEKILEELNNKVVAAEYLKKFKKVISFHSFRL